MTRRHPVPTRWLFTDERMGDGLWRALERLPRGGGVVFRHYATPAGERRRMFAKVVRIGRRRGLTVVRAGGVPMRGEDGVHGRRGQGLVTWPAHDRIEAIRGARAGAKVIFVSPMFATRSHPGSKSCRPVRAALTARGLGVAVMALGGMNEARFRRVRGLGFAGFGAIDFWVD